MKEALRIYSAEEGLFSESVKATEVKSHSHARKLAPFVNSSRQMLYWVGWGKPKKNNKPRVAHFKRYPSKNRSISTVASDEFEARYKESNESNKHKTAKRLVKNVLEKLLTENKHLPWAFNDPEISEFPMTGDFLAGAESIENEYSINTPMGKSYRFDIAILGKRVLKNPIV